MCFAQTEARLSKRCSCNGRRRPRVARHLQARLETRLETRRETRLERVARHFQARRSTGWRRVPLAPPILAHVMAHAQCERARLAPASARPAPRAAVTGRYRPQRPRAVSCRLLLGAPCTFGFLPDVLVLDVDDSLGYRIVHFQVALQSSQHFG